MLQKILVGPNICLQKVHQSINGTLQFARMKARDRENLLCSETDILSVTETDTFYE